MGLELKPILTDEDMVEAARWYRMAAEQGDPKGQLNLGVLYINGRGMEKDEARAAFWFRRAAEQGDLHAQNNIAYLYYTGRGVPRDMTYAYMWFAFAASQGSESAATMRDWIETQLSEEQIARARSMADEWQPGGGG